MSGDPITTYLKVQSALSEIPNKKKSFTVDKEHDDLRDAIYNHPKFFVTEHLVSGNAQKFLDETDLITTDGINLGKFNNLDIETLKSIATVAPFGKGEKTVVDTSVRNGIEIPATRLKEFDVSKILTDEFVGGNTIFESKLYKLHIYEKGGFFKTHTDTKHAKNHVATVILPLKSEHVGGDLEITHKSQRHVFKTSEQNDKQEQKYIFFYNDCPHEVKPVISGTRIVLQFDVYARSFDDDYYQDYKQEYWDTICCEGYSEAEESVEFDGIAFENKILDAVQNYFNENPKNKLGFILSHRYPISNEEIYLKGYDEMLINLLTQKNNYKVKFQSVLISSSSYDYDEPKDISVFPIEEKDLVDKVKRNATYSLENVHVLHPPVVFQADLVKLDHQNYIEHTGNEAQPGSDVLYAKIAIIY